MLLVEAAFVSSIRITMPAIIRSKKEKLAMILQALTLQQYLRFQLCLVWVADTRFHPMRLAPVTSSRLSLAAQASVLLCCILKFDVKLSSPVIMTNKHDETTLSLSPNITK
mmetsp:Transcript_59169/g.89255  ORF Transcript_59169/g.89255 Transcript_59169/m.89255 type:complete len:111 (-) Transcript_59169:137-469(-)